MAFRLLERGLKISLIWGFFFWLDQLDAIAAKSLHVGLHASWPSTSSAAEALAWIVQTTSNDQALPFLTSFSNKRSALADNDTFTEAVENRIILESAEELFPESFFSRTLDWVLHSRQLSPCVHLHYSVAEETLSTFREVSYHSIFAVKTDLARSFAALALQPDQLLVCRDCPRYDSREFDSHSLFHPLADEIHLNPTCTQAPTTILYADFSSTEFAAWIPQLTKAAHDCDQPIAFRFWKPQGQTQTHSPSLQGFTVQATLKSTEYKVVDDRTFETQLFADCGYGERICRRKNISEIEYHWPDADDGKHSTFTGLQLIQYLQNKANGDFDKMLEHLRIFAEDGPSVTRSGEFTSAMSQKYPYEKRLLRTLTSFRQSVGEEDLLYINGHTFETNLMRQGVEKVMGCLSAISSSTAQLRIFARELGQDGNRKVVLRTTPAQNRGVLRIDLRIEQHVPSSLIWFNDIFKDSRYESWPTLALDNDDDVSSFVDKVTGQRNRETKEGMDHTRLIKVKSNHLSLLFILDPGDEQQFSYLGIPESIIRADLPIHVGIVMVPNGRRSSMIAAAFHYFLRIKGRKTAVQFLSMIRQIMQYMGGGYRRAPISEQLIDMAFQQIAMHLGEGYSTVAEILEEDDEIRRKLEEAGTFAKSLSLYQNVSGENSGESERLSLLCLLNGVAVKDVATDVISTAIAEQQRIAALLESKNLHSARNGDSSFDQWVATDSELIILNRLSQDMRTEQTHSANREQTDGLSTIRASSVFAFRNDAKEINYIGTPKESSLVTVWLAAPDHASPSFKTAKDALFEIASSPFSSRTKSRFAVLPFGSALSSAVLECDSSLHCRTEPTYSINGRLISASTFTSLDDLFAEIASAFESQNMPEDVVGELGLFYQLHSSDVESKCTQLNDAKMDEDAVTFSSFEEMAAQDDLSNVTYMSPTMTNLQSQPISVMVLLDPTRRDSFLVVSLIEALKRAYSDEDLHVQLILAPALDSMKKHFDQPSTFRKFLLDPQSAFDGDSQKRHPPRLAFHRLPHHKVLTVSLEPPRVWFVSSFATNYDMDNMILDNIPLSSAELHAEYELKNLIVEGSCVDEAGRPPQGLQLIMENDRGIGVDTLVMANLGYFQLKVPAPGRWSIRLAPGPSSEIFAMKQLEMYKDGVRTVFDADGLSRISVHIGSLSGAGGILLRVERKPGMKGRSVLVSSKDAENGGEKRNFVGKMLHTVNRMYGARTKGKQNVQGLNNLPPVRNETIHVFSVASGHLYERFLKIMIISVTKHATRPVKFWLLENYLSPSFKKVLPLFASRYGADIGMVTYRWPGWLRAQTEKQRIIWAYKILFLDVLFPLDVGRIIFVDSDQVIRGDLAELMDIDLHGAPYGYVPFCDSRKEVEGYRFWKTGFWKETLKGAKYRISALYVVDLKRFRETAAGDTLRYIYQTLSADPNSLSNLDQDLPNYASAASSSDGDGVVPIFDLPQEWLWCESWCDDESKKSAKAIDLCNNPDTKEPKLESAKRIISEWVSYDDEASTLTEELYKLLLDEAKQKQQYVSKDSTNLRGLEAKDEL